MFIHTNSILLILREGNGLNIQLFLDFELGLIKSLSFVKQI